MSRRAHLRLAGATGLFVALVLGALLAPLQALLELRRPALAAGGKGAPPLSAGLEPGPSLGTRRAASPLAARYDGRGRLRRLYFPVAPGLVGGPEERARELLAQESVRLGLAPGVALELVDVRTSPSGAHARFQQTLGGIPVWGGDAVVSFDRDLRPTLLASDVVEIVAAERGAPRLAPAVALERALGALAVRSPLAAPARTELAYRAFGGELRLQYRVSLACEEPMGDWEVWVDAATGAVLAIRDRTLHISVPSDGAGRRVVSGAVGRAQVFRPDPVTATGNAALSDHADADAAVPDSAYVPVTLPDLEAPLRGYYRLAGPHALLEDWESPWGEPDSSASADFVHTRSQQGFEDAMVYYHIASMQRWYQTLGFQDANNRSQPADAHGMRGEDNSKYVPSLRKLSFGEGGVDDAEDAAVIVHEYAHATQHDIVPTWGLGGDEGAMGEGFGDYLANSYAYGLFPQRVRAWNGVFQWDGHNEYWLGRVVVDPSKHYPEDAGGEVHAAGTLWCSGLTDALYTIGDRAAVDRLILDHHYALTGSATMEDAADAILASDMTLYGGAHLGALAQVFERWGFVGAAPDAPVFIQFRPLDIAAREEGLPEVRARIVSGRGRLDPASVRLCVRPRGAAFDSVPMLPQGGDVFTAGIAVAPSANLVLEYFLEARDEAGEVARSPIGAPAVTYVLCVGLVADRFETESGWQVGVPGDGAVRGVWERAEPVGTLAQPGSDHTWSGTQCFVTGNGAAAAPAGDADVDGGATTLLSPVYDLRGATGASLRYWRWYSNNLGTFPGEDIWAVDASNDAGRTWTPVERTLLSDASWQLVEFDLGAALGPPAFVRLRFVASDTGGNSLVEAAVDDLTLLARFATEAAPAPGVAAGTSCLLANVPNPCNPGTTLRFVIGRAGPASLAVYDVRGRLVRTLLEARLEAGPHVWRWDGTDVAGLRAPSGTYVVRLVAPDACPARKLTLLQ